MIKALGNRIFLEKDTLPEKVGNIIMPEVKGQYAPPYSGIVISVGPGVEDPDIIEGAHILFHDLAGVEFEVNGNTVFSIREHDVTAILVKNISNNSETN